MTSPSRLFRIEARRSKDLSVWITQRFVFTPELLGSVWMTNDGELANHRCGGNVLTLCERGFWLIAAAIGWIQVSICPISDEGSAPGEADCQVSLDQVYIWFFFYSKLRLKMLWSLWTMFNCRICCKCGYNIKMYWYVVNVDII